MKPKPVAILCADLHLSLTPPACRAETPEEWLGVQAHYLKQLEDLQTRLWNEKSSIPIPSVLCAGDIFDRWNTPPELLHFAMDHLPHKMICVPGQHDLPNHSIERMKECGYGVLKRSKHIIDLSDQKGYPINMIAPDFFVQGFGWNQEIMPPERRKQSLSIALIHRYVWTIKSGYPGAPEESHLEKLIGPLKGYNIAVFGDNHCPFQKKLKTGTLVFNCGTFIRRKADEINYKPHVGILYSDGTVKPHYLDTSIDRFHDRPEEREQKEFDMRAFLESLEDLGEQGLNFHTAVENYLRDNKVTPSVKAQILEMLQ